MYAPRLLLRDAATTISPVASTVTPDAGSSDCNGPTNVCVQRTALAASYFATQASSDPAVSVPTTTISSFAPTATARAASSPWAGPSWVFIQRSVPAALYFLITASYPFDVVLSRPTAMTLPEVSTATSNA